MEAAADSDSAMALAKDSLSAPAGGYISAQDTPFDKT